MVALWLALVGLVVRIGRNMAAFLARVLGVKYANLGVFRLPMI